MKGGSKNAPFMFCDKSFSTHYIKSSCTFLGISCQDKAGIQPCVANQSSSHQTSPAPARALPQIGVAVLSMGMSHDFEVAIEEGATCVRVGTAIFGAREKSV